MRIQDLLARPSRPLLADGAFGTYYRSLTHSDAPPELANLAQPQLVLDVHRRYVAAGAQVLYSNTFAANQNLTSDTPRLQAIIEAGLNLARQAAGENAAVLADIGDIGWRENVGEEQAAEEYLQLAQLFIAAGATDFVFETMPELSPLLPALAYLRQEQPDAFIMVSFAVSQDGYSKKGLYYKDLLDAAYASGAVSAAGLNCVCGPGHMARLLADYPPAGRLIAALPNAGYPRQVNNRLVYEDNPDYYAQRLAELAALGCFMVGGCCGTTPQHIAAALSVESPLSLRDIPPLARGANQWAKPRDLPPLSKGGGCPQGRRGDSGAFLQKLQNHQPALVVELNPPISAADAGHFLAAAQKAAEAGADIISVTDSPLARARADSLMLAAKLRRELGVEVLPHLSCRDRNRLGLKSALLAASIEDIRYVLAVRGDAASDADGVFSLNSRELMAFIASLNRELLGDTGFTYGGALNVNAANFAAELKRAVAKQEAGCAFFLTQPVFDENAAQNAALAAQTLNSPVLAGILPLAGYKNALFLQQEVGGIQIPAALINSLKQADAAEARAIALDHCREMMRRLKPACGGFYLMTPLNRIDMVCQLVTEARS